MTSNVHPNGAFLTFMELVKLFFRMNPLNRTVKFLEKVNLGTLKFRKWNF